MNGRNPESQDENQQQTKSKVTLVLPVPFNRSIVLEVEMKEAKLTRSYSNYILLKYILE